MLVIRATTDFLRFRTSEDNEEKHSTAEGSHQAQAWGKTNLAGITAQSLRFSRSWHTSLAPFEAWSLLYRKG